MSRQELVNEQVEIEVENVGGIEQTDVSFEPGVTLLTGRNATNRTSFLHAIMAGLGSKQATLKGDADKGRVTLELGDETYTRELARQDGSVRFVGDPYLDDPELANLFAFLLESNEARRTVARGDNLRDIIMRPVDAEAIEAEIQELKSEREDVKEQIEEREALGEKLPKLEEQRNSVAEQIEEQRSTLQQKRKELEARETDTEKARAEQSELEEKIQILQQTREQSETLEYRLDTERESLESLESELAELKDEYESLQDTKIESTDHIDSEISQLREKKQRLDTELNKLQSVIQFNEEMLEGSSQDIASALRGQDTGEGDALTDQFLDDQDELICWTCGTEVAEAGIKETLDQLQDHRKSKYSKQSDIEDELAELKDRKSNIEATRQKRSNLEERIASVEAEMEEREAKIEELQAKYVKRQEDVERLEEEIEELEKHDRSEHLDLRREVNELELELERLENEKDRVEAQIEEIETQFEEIKTLEERRADISEELEDVRTRIDRIEFSAIKEFNEHMATVLDLLDYENLDRIWVERVEEEVRKGRRKVTEREFRLNIVRSTADDVTYKDEFSHLSESEREVTGLVFALAGYLGHEVYEEVPFILLDSLEAIDADRIATLVDYMHDYADYLVVALLPEDAAALDDEYERVTDI